MEPAHDAVWEWVSPHTLWNHRMPKQRVRNGAWIKYPVEVLHESSPNVFKIITVMQQKGQVVIIDRRCLFAFDIINGLFVASPQQAGIKCPCCNKNQEQWDLEQNIGKRSRNVGIENQGFITIEQSELRQIQRLTCAIV